MAMVRIPRLVCLFSFALCAAISAGAQQKELIIDATTAAPSSPTGWMLDGLRFVPTESGAKELVLEPVTSGLGSDLYLDFEQEALVDTAGNWNLAIEGTVSTVKGGDARSGLAAGSFKAPHGKISLKPVRSGFFGTALPAGDFSISFWLKPTRADNGEIIFLWKSSRSQGKSWFSQQMTCLILRNRVNFGFLNFFANPEGGETSLSLQASDLIVPGIWSHHLLRFDADTGLLEYLADGKPQALLYVTKTKKEGSTVFPAIIGGSGRMDVAPNYTGLIDDFRIANDFGETPDTARFEKRGGTALSPIFDLGLTNSRPRFIEVKARAAGEAAIHYSYRLADEAVGWTEESPAWIPFSPGTALSPNARGRYIQLRYEIFTDGYGKTSPALSWAKLVYEPDYPPPPPAELFASAGNGTITVRWTPVSESDVIGYVVYYGTAPGTYFGTGAREGNSPVFILDPGRTSISLTGLQNGTLYFIAVATLDSASPPHVGDFSREVSARPSKVGS